MLNNLHSFSMIVTICEYISIGRYVSTRTIEFEVHQNLACLHMHLPKKSGLNSPLFLTNQIEV